MLITQKTAVELGRRSGKARRELRERVEFMTANLLTLANPNNRLIPEPDIARTLAELVRIVSEQIASTRALLNELPKPCTCEHCGKDCGHEFSMAPHHRAQLLKALDSLIERKTTLLGIPGPGNLKPSSRTGTATRRPSFVEPTLSPNCGQDTPSNSVPTPEPNQ